ncbi:MAG TPA: ester cyclase [Candidatus Limnocylindrales bacterium]|nr:ester cyclase [Candidatus Limnocylindrales bacterium]
MGNNAEIVRRLISEAWPGDNLDLLDAHVAEEYLEHAPFGQVVGREGYREGIALFNGAFSGLRLEVHEVIEQGDHVAARFTFRGRHAGEFMDIPPSGRDVVMEGITMTRLEAGQVVEEWLAIDLLGLMQQMQGASAGD